MNKARFVLSRSKVIEQYNKLKAIDADISYSFKTNEEVGKVLEEETGCLFSVHFENDLPFLKDKSRVIFLAQGLNEEQLNRLFSFGINKFVVDNLVDLDTLTRYIEKNNKKILLLLRMKLKENTIHTGKYFVFGMESKLINEKIIELKNNKNIEKIGIHVHRKTQNVSEWSLKYELSEALDEKTLKLLDIVCIGGGIPGNYKNVSDKSIEYVFNKIAEVKEWLSSYNIKTLIEPGRFLAAYPVTLETEIINIVGNTIIVNCSVYNSAMDTIIVPIKLLVKGELEGGEAYTIKGYTPCSLDIFRYKVFLKNPKIGDKIIFLNAGAYNFSTDFCNLEKLETIIVD
ncbi:MAG: decarboxylase [Candidatus Woesearchaeota archaeon]|nr:decarboxylase [Candidatus Woesearchaeota archaeon]